MQPSDRLLAMIGAFSLERPVLALSEVAELTGVPTSTAHRLLERLVAWEVLEKDEQKRYSIGSRLWEKAVLSRGHFQQRTTVLPYLERLFVATHCECALTVLHSDGSLVIEQLLGWMDGPVAADLGQHLPLHATSPGLVALAFGPSTLWESVTRRTLPRFTARTTVDLDRLAQRVRQTRRQGCARSDGELVASTISVSAPVFDRTGRLYGAVSLVWGVGGEPSAPADAVRGAAHSITEAMRAVDPHSAPRSVMPRPSGGSPTGARE